MLFLSCHTVGNFEFTLKVRLLQQLFFWQNYFMEVVSLWQLHKC